MIRKTILHARARGVKNRLLLLCLSSLHVAVFLPAIAGVAVPYVRPLLGAVYLSFVPGMLLLSILDLDVDFDEVIAHGIPLSWVFFLVHSAVLAVIIPVDSTFSESIIVRSFAMSTTGLFALYYLRHGSTDAGAVATFGTGIRDIRHLLRPRRNLSLLLYAVLFFLVAIAGTLLLYNKLGTEAGVTAAVLLGIGFPAVAAYVAMDDTDTDRGPNIYKLSTILLTLGLLYLRSTVSPYINGPDVVRNFAHVRLTIATEAPQLGFQTNYASILTPHVLAPIHLYIGGITTNMFYKFVVPALLGIIVTVALWRLFTGLGLNNFHVTLAVLLVVFNTQFFLKMPSLVKQMNAEVFLLPLILLGFRNRFDQRMKFTALVLLFISGLIVSHYTTTFIYLGVTAAVLLVAPIAHGIFTRVSGRDSQNPGGVIQRILTRGETDMILLPATLLQVALLGIMAFAWYDQVGQSYVIEIGVTILASAVLSGASAGGAATLAAPITGIGAVGILVLQVLTVLLTGAGMVGSFRAQMQVDTVDDRIRYKRGYLVFCGCIALIGVVYLFSNPTFGLVRYVHFLVLFTSPYAIIALRGLFRAVEFESVRRLQTPVLCLFLMMTLGFNAGAVSVVAGGPQISLYGIEDATISDEDIAASSFILTHSNDVDTIIGDRQVDTKFNSVYIHTEPDPSRLQLVGRTSTFVQINAKMPPISSQYPDDSTYLFLHSGNTRSGTIEILSAPRGTVGNPQIVEAETWQSGPLRRSENNRIYDSNGSEVWQPH
jgi:uncharacterized membrane protein